MASVDFRSSDVSKYFKASNDVLNQAGLGDTKAVKFANSVFTTMENPSGAAEGFVDQMGDATGLSNSTGGSMALGFLKGLTAAVISAILGGDMSAPQAEIKEATDSLTFVKNTTANGQQVGTQTLTQSNQILTNSQGSVDTTRTNMDDSVNQINTGNERATEAIDKNNSEKEKKQAQVDANKEKIQEKQREKQQIDAQIAFKVAAPYSHPVSIPITGNNKGPAGAKAPKGGSINLGPAANNGNNQTQGTGNGSSTGGADVSSLLSKSVSLGLEITGLQNENIGLVAEMSDGNAKTSDLVSSITNISTEQADNLDAQTEQIKSTIQDAKGAAKELYAFMQGQFPQFDKALLTKISYIAGKATVNGVNSGTLAALAASLGASSIVSMGSTAMQAKNAGEGSVKYGTASAMDYAKVALETQLKSTFENYMRQNVLSPLSQVTGVDLGQVYDMAMSMGTEAKGSMKSDFVGDQGEQKQEQLEEQQQRIDEQTTRGATLA